jgi:hypothetical protein
MEEDGIDPKDLLKNMQGEPKQKKKTKRATPEAFIDLAINLWRLENAISYLHLADESPEKNRLDRHLTASKDSLLQLGIEYEDHTGELVPDKGEYALRVVEYIPKENITNDVVIETIKPSVYYLGKMISPGEVFVGIPVSNNSEEENNFVSFVNKMQNFLTNIWKNISRS